MKKLLKRLTIKESGELLELLKEHGLESNDNEKLLKQLKKAEYPVAKAVLNKLIQFNFEAIVASIYLQLVDIDLWAWKSNPLANVELERHISAENLRHHKAKSVGKILQGFTPELIEHITLLQYPKSKDLLKCTSIKTLAMASLEFVNYLHMIGCSDDKDEVSKLILALEPENFERTIEEAFLDDYSEAEDDDDEIVE